MKLAIFDVDGTLTNTNLVDAMCFGRVLTEELGVSVAETKWSGFTTITDSGIIRDIFQSHYGRSPLAAEVARLRECFMALLQAAASQTPEAFGPVPGAAELLQQLPRDGTWVVAIATGCWKASALLKLSAAGIATEGVPAAFAEDAWVREDIVRTAIERAKEEHGQCDFERVVSIGDGPWDVAVAQRLGVPFVGVGHDGHGDRLLRLGTSHVLMDFTNLAAVVQGLETATVPAGVHAAR